MSNKITELRNGENSHQRLLRENSLVTMGFILAMMLFANGLVIGFAASKIMDQSEKYERMMSAYEVSSTWHSAVHAQLRDRGLDLPEIEVEEEEDQ